MKRVTPLFVCFCAGAWLARTEPVAAQCAFTESATLVPSPALPGNSEFGCDVAVHGDVAVVGARSVTVSGHSNAGAAYIYRHNGSVWQQEARLDAPSPSAWERFGWSVATDGDTVVVGTYGITDTAYVYRYNGATWAFEQTLVPANSAGNFGYDVTIEADTIAVGVPNFDFGVSAAVVFNFNGAVWMESQRLTGGGSYGVSLDLNGDTLLVGAFTAPLGGGTGAAHVYRYDSSQWVLEQTLGPGDPSFNKYFGFSVDLHGDAAVIGAYCDGAAGACAGAGYVFRRSGVIWTQEQKIVPPYSEQDVQSGRAVALANDLALLTTRSSPDFGGSPAATYRYSSGSWTLESWLAPSDVFGIERPLSAHGNRAVMGLPEFGNARVFDVAMKDCNGNSIADSIDIASALSQDCQANCVPDECDVVTADCNLNAIPDACDVLNGHDTDCNFDQISDGCEISSNPSLDCDANASIDACPLALFSATGDAPDAEFGKAVGLSGELLAVGLETPGAANRGAVHVFQRTEIGWSGPDLVVPADAQADDRFGRAVALDGIRMLVGAPFADGTAVNSGSAYVFRLENGDWQLEQKLMSPASASGDEFGGAVALDDPLLVVSAVRNAVGGMVHVYERVGLEWIERARLQAGSPVAGGSFGSAVALDQDRVAASDLRSEKVYLFERLSDKWPLAATVLPPTVGSRFGSALDLQGDDLLIGAVDSNLPPFFRAGAVFWHQRDGLDWPQRQRLDNPAPLGGSLFGRAIALDGLDLIVGASSFRNFGPPLRNGLVFHYQRGDLDWELAAQLKSTTDGEDAFGYAAVVDDGVAAIGAPMDSIEGEPEVGAVSIWDLRVQRSPMPEPAPIAKSRFVSFSVQPSCGSSFAIRVTLRSLYRPAGSPGVPDFSASEGETRYLNAFLNGSGDPVYFCADSGDSDPYACARLGCSPEYRDWATNFAGQTVHLTGPSVVPSSWYEVAQLPSTCQGDEELCAEGSLPLTVLTGTWGDIDPGVLNVIDVGRQIDKVKGVASAYPEFRCMLKPNSPSPDVESVNVTEIGYVVDALKGLPYPFTGPETCP